MHTNSNLDMNVTMEQIFNALMFCSVSDAVLDEIRNLVIDLDDNHIAENYERAVDFMNQTSHLMV